MTDPRDDLRGLFRGLFESEEDLEALLERRASGSVSHGTFDRLVLDIRSDDPPAADAIVGSPKTRTGPDCPGRLRLFAKADGLYGIDEHGRVTCFPARLGRQVVDGGHA